MDGWIKLHRSITDWEHWGNVNTMAVWLWILVHTAYEETRVDGHTLQRGECRMNQAQCARDLNLTRQEVREAVKRLKKSGEIEQPVNNHLTADLQPLQQPVNHSPRPIIRVCNFDKYQTTSSTTSSNAKNNEKTTSDYTLYKEEKNKKNFPLKGEGSSFLNSTNSEKKYSPSDGGRAFASEGKRAASEKAVKKKKQGKKDDYWDF